MYLLALIVGTIVAVALSFVTWLAGVATTLTLLGGLFLWLFPIVPGLSASDMFFYMTVALSVWVVGFLILATASALAD